MNEIRVDSYEVAPRVGGADRAPWRGRAGLAVGVAALVSFAACAPTEAPVSRPQALVAATRSTCEPPPSTFVYTSQRQAATVGSTTEFVATYTTRAGETGRLVWTATPTSRRLAFYPRGAHLLTLDLTNPARIRIAASERAPTRASLDHLAYVFPHLLRDAQAQGQLHAVPRTLCDRGCTVDDQTEDYQGYGECMDGCQEPAVVPSGAGAACRPKDAASMSGNELYSQCHTCCSDAYPGCGTGPGGGGFGLACDVGDVYCNMLKIMLDAPAGE